MSTIKNNINTYANLTAYNNDLNKDFPNVSYIQKTDEVKWYKYDPDHIVAVYNVTSTDTATKLLQVNTSITYQIIDGVRQNTVQMNYTFDTLGEHIVKYKMNVTYFRQTLFYMCPNLISAVIPETITRIDDALFYSCSNLTNVVLPKTLTQIGDIVFEYCSRLTTISIPNGVTEIRNCFGNSGLTYIDLPNSVTTLNATFNNVQSLKRVNSNVDGECNIPDSVTTIGGSAFNGCTGLTSINIPDSVTTISGNATFAGNRNLRQITIGSGITSISNQATTNSVNIQSITIKATTPPTISELTWQTTTCPIYVPSQSVESYKTTGNWVTYADRIQAIPTT